MDALTINRLIKGLGQTYETLLADDLVSGVPPVQLLTGGNNEDLIQKPALGIELWFWAETRRLERITVTLTAVVDSDQVYTGELPNPFTLSMRQADIRAVLGEPYQSKGPAKLPPPIGVTGGWDAYRFGQDTHTNAEVVVQYLSDHSVAGLAFCLIDRGHH
nr:DUF6392 family protein [uncultured Pseudomonas sp.]